MSKYRYSLVLFFDFRFVCAVPKMEQLKTGAQPLPCGFTHYGAWLKFDICTLSHSIYGIAE